MAVLLSAICAEAQLVQTAKVSSNFIYWKTGAEFRTTSKVLDSIRTLYAYVNTSWYSNMFVKVKVTKTSGYQRGYVKLQGAVDSTGPWYTVRGTTTQCVPCADSNVTIGNATQTVMYDVRGFHFNHLRGVYVSDTATTASVASFEVWGSH